MPETTVVLATYNGEKYIAEFLESLVSQSYRDFDVVVSDDCSTDNTISIIKSFQQTLKISILENSTNVGPSLNFCRATDISTGQLIAFADQDDVWRSDKLSLMVNVIKERGELLPQLVFCDLAVTNEKLEITSPSFFSGLKSSACSRIEDFIISSHIPGCAMLINRPLLTLAMPVPPLFRMHDWWFAITAAAFGRITFLDRPLVSYRQHRGNVIGAGSKKAPRSAISKILRLITAPRTALTNRIAPLRSQAKMINCNVAAFSDRFSGSLGDRERNILRAFQKKRLLLSRMKILAGAQLGESKFNALLMSFMV